MILRLLRVNQWVKNLFVFLPVIFSGNMLNPSMLLKGLEAFLVFSLTASSVYILNDILDRKSDALHPVKCRRPIASGRVKLPLAVATAALLLVAAFALIPVFFQRTVLLTGIIAGYYLLNVAYSVKLKQFPIVDVMIIAIGFVLRVLCGGYGCGIWVSPWLVMMVFLLTLLIAFGKRRDDVLRMEHGEGTARRSVAGYNLTFINQVLSLLAATVVITYICYTLTPQVEARFRSGSVYLTSIFVIAAVIRFLQIAYVREQSGEPSKIIYRDRFMQACCVLWLLAFMLIIYVR